MNNIDFEYCIVANIFNQSTDSEVRYNKHFSAGTKVYCFFKYGGMGHERLIVIGKHKVSHRNIEIVVSRNLIENVRVKKVYDNYIIQKIRDCGFYTAHKNKNVGVDCLIQFAEIINNITK